MNHQHVQAEQLKPGMILIPAIQGMRYAIVEKIKSFDEVVSPGSVPRDMRNHNDAYVVVMTDVGPKSFPQKSLVNVMVHKSPRFFY
jgi:hypothetical protein